MFGEVFICQFPLTSGAAGKVRPALALFDVQRDAVICRITSVARSGPLDVVLNDWQIAGLLKSSVARLDRLVTAEKTVFMRRLGVLSPADLAAVRNYMEQPNEVILPVIIFCEKRASFRRAKGPAQLSPGQARNERRPGFPARTTEP